RRLPLLPSPQQNRNLLPRLLPPSRNLLLLLPSQKQNRKLLPHPPSRNLLLLLLPSQKQNWTLLPLPPSRSLPPKRLRPPRIDRSRNGRVPFPNPNGDPFGFFCAAPGTCPW